MLFSSDSTYCIVKKTSRDYENEKAFPFVEKILHQSQSVMLESVQTEAEIFRNIALSCLLPLIDAVEQLTRKSFPFSFHTFSVHKKATWFSQSQTMVLTGLSTLDQIQSILL